MGVKLGSSLDRRHHEMVYERIMTTVIYTSGQWRAQEFCSGGGGFNKFS